MENVTQPHQVIHPWVFVWRVASDKTNYRRIINHHYIIDLISVYYESAGLPITSQVICGRSRRSLYVVPRYMAWYFIYKYSGLNSLKSVGLLFNRDHSTIINGIKRLKNYCETERDTRKHFQNICQLLNVEEYEKG